MKKDSEIMNLTNFTEDMFTDNNQTFTVSPWERPLLLSLYCITFCTSICGNVGILIVLCKLPSHTVTNIFIGSLCICDILMTVFCVPVTIVSDLIFLYWPFWTFLCPVVLFLQVVAVVQRSLTLLTMTLHKHDSVWRPLRSCMKRRVAKLVIVVVWALSFGVAIPTFTHSDIVYLDSEPGSNGLCIETWDQQSSRSVYSYLLMTIQYLAPVSVMTLSYIHISYIIWAKKPPGEKDELRDERIASSKRRAVKMMMMVVLVYVLCWLPLHTLTLIGEQNESFFNERFAYFAWILSNWLAFSNSAVNPIVYFWMNEKYRQTLKQFFQSCGSVRRPELGLSYFSHPSPNIGVARDTFVSINCSRPWRNGSRYRSMAVLTNPLNKYNLNDTGTCIFNA